MDVTVYLTEICPFCHMEKRFLKQNNIEFKEIDLLKNREAAKNLKERTGTLKIPQTEINGKIIVGFKKEALKKELGL